VVVGDFIDRGPHSAKVVSTLEWWQRNFSRVTILKGNHEAALLASMAGDPRAQHLWLSYGGFETLKSFGVEPRKGCSSEELAALIRSSISRPTIAWLEQLPLSMRIGTYFFSHAGVKPGTPLEQQSPEHLLWGSNDFLDSRRDHGAAIVHGHTICGSRVHFAPNRICIDTGAYLTGILSAVGLEGDRQWSISTPPEPVWPSVGAIGQGGRAPIPSV
jgi:serine/threonine protein phosphatase 1